MIKLENCLAKRAKMFSSLPSGAAKVEFDRSERNVCDAQNSSVKRNFDKYKICSEVR